MSRKLKRCPFCGERAVLIASDKAFVVCEECGVATPVHDTEEEAIEVWNNRKPMDDIVEQLDRMRAGETPEWDDGFYTAVHEAIEIVKGGINE